MKGIILAGGTGSRLWPSTISVSKQLIPVYDKPMIYYPLSTLMLAGIREILIITTPGDQAAFKKLLGTGETLGINLSYSTQERPEGLAQAFLIGEKFIGSEGVALILGDNVFHGGGFSEDLFKYDAVEGAAIFGIQVTDPQRYGVAEIDSNGAVISLEEKPKFPKSNLAVPGLYLFDSSVCSRASRVQKSSRGELEIVSLLDMYRKESKLSLTVLSRGIAWMDCGTPASLIEAGNYIRAIEERQGYKVGAIEEIAWRNSWITSAQLSYLADKLGKNEYANYLNQLAL